MVLGFAVGWSLESFAGLSGGIVCGVLAGMVAASLVPLGPGCADEDR